MMLALKQEQVASVTSVLLFMHFDYMTSLAARSDDWSQRWSGEYLINRIITQ